MMRHQIRMTKQILKEFVVLQANNIIDNVNATSVF